MPGPPAAALAPIRGTNQNGQEGATLKLTLQKKDTGTTTMTNGSNIAVFFFLKLKRETIADFQNGVLTVFETDC